MQTKLQRVYLKPDQTAPLVRGENRFYKFRNCCDRKIYHVHVFYRGINVLEKPELQKTFDNRRQTQRAKEWDEQKKSHSKRTSLEMKLEERAHKLKEVRISWH